jgi:hypothetical protein
LPAIALVLALAAPGCRCGEGPSAPGSSAEVDRGWAMRWSPGILPATPLAGSIRGEEIDDVHVQVRAGDGRTRIEVMEGRPPVPCGLIAGARGISVRIPVALDGASELAKAADEHPSGWSAYMVGRRDGTSVSALARAWSFALKVDDLDAGGGRIEGRLAVSFDDEARSGVAGSFSGEYCSGDAGD